MNQNRWQERFLPLMTGTLIVLSVFFFLSSLGQLSYLHTAIRTTPDLDTEAVSEDIEALAGGETEAEREAFRLALLSRLELHTIARRYHIAHVALMASVWVKYLGFVTGMILSVVGAVFILGKLRTPKSEIGAEVASIRYHVRSASPGIILAALGVALMLTTVVTRYSVRVTDKAVYISETHLTETADDDGAPPNPETR
jgi:hypothetical protein